MRRLHRPAIAGALLALATLHSFAVAVAADAATNEPITAVGPITITHVVHFAPQPTADVVNEAGTLLKTRYSALKVRTKREESVPGTSMYYELLDMKKEGFEPPSLEMLKYYARGVSGEQARAMQSSTHAAAVTFTYPAAEALTAVRQADAFVQELAARTGGLVWDVETRELFSPQALAEARLGPLDQGFPDVRRHITIHAYQAAEYVRAITLGMAKFGLPDLVINEFAWSLNRPMGNAINLFAQALLEGATPKRGPYDFDVRTLKHKEVRAVYELNLLEDSQPIALLTLTDAAADEGDPDNRLLELRFDRYAGASVHEKHEKFSATFYGSTDTVSYIKHNDAIRAASERARKRLPALRTAFNKGLEPGERLLLKAPFKTPDDGVEWMWVEVSAWKRDRIRGLLGNEPAHIPDLHAGATVDVDEDDVFDYLFYKADGSEEGNETGKEIQRLEDAR